jgi:hypothetical protein
MSWKMTREVREARLAGQLPGINFAEFSVLLIAAETCRGDSRAASISMIELVNLSGQERTSMSRAVKKLVALRYLRKVGGGNQFQASSYDVLPDACGADATCTEPDACGADATCTEREHVAFETEHVAFEPDACGASATYPFTPEDPEGGLRKSGTSPGAAAPDSNDPSPDDPSSNGEPANAAAATDPFDYPDDEPPDGLPPNHWPADYPKPEPPRFCPRHPDDTTERCGACKETRREHDAWKARRDGWRHAKHENKCAWIAACDECDEEGWLLGPDRTPIDDPSSLKCWHARNWGAYWEQRFGRPLGPRRAGEPTTSGERR